MKKSIIEEVKYDKEKETKWGQMVHQYKVWYDGGKLGFFQSSKKDQDHFVRGQECEFEELELKGRNDEPFYILKLPKKNQRFNARAKESKREQAKYSGFAASYVKDLIVANKIQVKDWVPAMTKIFWAMVELDQELEQKLKDKADDKDADGTTK